MPSDVMVCLAKDIDNYNSKSDLSQNSAFFYFSMARKGKGDIQRYDTQHNDLLYDSI